MRTDPTINVENSCANIALTVAYFNYYRSQGYSQAQIARMFNVTPQRVSQVKALADDPYLTPRERALRKFPWNTRGFTKAYLNQLLRNHVVYTAGYPDELNGDQVKRLFSFYRKIVDDKLVVEFDPNITAEQSGMNGGGFRYVCWEPEDEDFIIRRNEYTILERDVESLWTLPHEIRE